MLKGLVNGVYWLLNRLTSQYFLSQHSHTFFSNPGFIRTPITVVGEFYFEEFFRSHAWLKMPDPLKYQSSPFCLPGGRRTMQVPRPSQLLEVDGMEGVQDHRAVVHSHGHLLTRDEGSGQLTNVKVLLVQDQVKGITSAGPSIDHYGQSQLYFALVNKH
jgi:hypothetical protein